MCPSKTEYKRSMKRHVVRVHGMPFENAENFWGQRAVSIPHEKAAVLNSMPPFKRRRISQSMGLILF